MNNSDRSIYLLGRAIDRALELEALPAWDWDATYDSEQVRAHLRKHGIDWLPQNPFAPTSKG